MGERSIDRAIKPFRPDFSKKALIYLAEIA